MKFILLGILSISSLSVYAIHPKDLAIQAYKSEMRRPGNLISDALTSIQLKGFRLSDSTTALGETEAIFNGGACSKDFKNCKWKYTVSIDFSKIEDGQFIYVAIQAEIEADKKGNVETISVNIKD